jgi:uncharacterized protein (DUF2147 family)
MERKTAWIVGLGLVAGMILSGPVRAADATGLWLTEDGKAKIRIARCGEAVCGAIAWMKEPNGPDGKPRLDVENKDQSLRGRPMMGLPILLGLMPDRPDRLKGQVYNAEDGRIYTGFVTVQPDRTLKLEGCVLGGLICESQIWTRAD